MRGLALMAALVALPSLAQADVVYTVPCPFGARERTSHAGPRCEPWTCATDADCEGDLVCQPWRVCVQTHDVPIAGRGAWGNPPPPPTREELVVASCAPSESCSGTESPRAPTRGQPIGDVRCAVAPHCVRPPFPPIPSAPPPPAEASEASSTAPAERALTEQPPIGGTACGCRVGSPSSSVPMLALLAVGLLLCGRARRAARKHGGSTAHARRIGDAAKRALAFSAIAGATLGARAQDTPLPPGWERTHIQPAPLFQTVALACDRERAYVRDWQGEVRVFDGQRWTSLPRAPEGGGDLWASPSGRVVVAGSRAAHAWDGTRWSGLAIDPWFAEPPRGRRAVFAIDGLGESPWILGRGAVGLDVPTDEGPLLRAHDVAGAWYALNDLEVLAHDRVYVASAAGLLRWDGRAWSIVPTGIEGEVGGVHAFASDDVWAWADTGVAHFDGRAWTRRGEGLELPGPPPWRGSSETRVHLGGRPAQVFLTTGDRVYRLDGTRWTVELDAQHRHPIGRGYGEVCATERFVVIAEHGYALVRR